MNIPPHNSSSAPLEAPSKRRSTMPPELPAVRILIVDDDKAICEYMQTLLERDGFQVRRSATRPRSRRRSATAATTSSSST